MNIHYPIDDKNISAYINGKTVNNFLEQKIEPYQSAVILIGKHNNNEQYLKKAVTKQQIKAIEKQSETCSS